MAASARLAARAVSSAAVTLFRCGSTRRRSRGGRSRHIADIVDGQAAASCCRAAADTPTSFVSAAAVSFAKSCARSAARSALSPSGGTLSVQNTIKLPMPSSSKQGIIPVSSRSDTAAAEAPCKHERTTAAADDRRYAAVPCSVQMQVQVEASETLCFRCFSVRLTDHLGCAHLCNPSLQPTVKPALVRIAASLSIAIALAACVDCAAWVPAMISNCSSAVLMRSDAVAI